MTLPPRVRAFLAARLTPADLAWLVYELEQADWARGVARRASAARAAHTRALKQAIRAVRAGRARARKKLDKPFPSP